MPTTATCYKCHRSLPVNAQMQTDQGSLPLLVVLSEVDSVEAALEAVTCQMCLDRKGPIERGLVKVLKALGAEDLDSATPAPRGAVIVSSDQSAHKRGVVVVQRGPSQEVAIFDALAGTSLVLPTRVRSGRDRRGSPHRGHDWRPAPSEPRLPRALRESEPARQQEPPVEHLTGSIGASGNKAVLEAARVGIRQRDEARRLERAEKFERIFFWLRLTLARIRKNAAEREVWDLVDTFERKLGEAAELDVRRRGKKSLLAELGTSREELESFCLLVYEKPSEWKRVRGTVSETIDAFEGGARPESWDIKGGKKPAFYELEILRPMSSLPIPNPPLPGGDEDPRPRITYPEDGKYGSDYEIHNSRHLAGIESKIDELVAEMTNCFNRWLAIAHEDIGIGSRCERIDISAHLPTFFEALKQALADEAEEAAEPAIATISSDLPANT